MKVIVITGGTRGLGLGLAQAFLQMGHAVALFGRTAEPLETAVETLARMYGRDRVWGRTGDVRDFHNVQDLWDTSRQMFSKVDIWVNNAGLTNPPGHVWEQSEKEIADVVNTNVLGVVYGCKVAARGMLAQGFGSIYTVLGMEFESGSFKEGHALHRAGKLALGSFTQELAGELKGTPVLAGAVYPGLVLTDSLARRWRTSAHGWEQVKRLLNRYGERIDTAAPWLAERMLENKRNGVEIKRLSTTRLLGRILTHPFNRYRVIK